MSARALGSRPPVCSPSRAQRVRGAKLAGAHLLFELPCTLARECVTTTTATSKPLFKPPPPCSYPSFVDALRDLDDPLTMVHLFAVLPAERAHSIPAPVVALARRLALEWQAWVVRAHALRKTFISVKG